MWSRTRIEVIVAGAVMALAVAAGVAWAGPTARDQIVQSNGIECHRLASIAILPAVSVCGDALAERRAEFGWRALYVNAKTSWMPADEVCRRMSAASGGSGDLAGAVRAQIWRSGTLDARTAQRLARLLGVDAVLSLRIDRWEIADGGRGMVELEANLMEASGQPLWSARGVAGHGRGRLGNEGAFPIGAAGYWGSHHEPDDCDHRTCTAFYTLLARWAPVLPTPVYEQDMPHDLLAQVRGE